MLLYNCTSDNAHTDPNLPVLLRPPNPNAGAVDTGGAVDAAAGVEAGAPANRLGGAAGAALAGADAPAKPLKENPEAAGALAAGAAAGAAGADELAPNPENRPRV